MLVEAEPDRFFVPAYVGHRGWLGVYLDVQVDWDEIRTIVEGAYRPSLGGGWPPCSTLEVRPGRPGFRR